MKSRKNTPTHKKMKKYEKIFRITAEKIRTSKTRRSRLVKYIVIDDLLKTNAPPKVSKIVGVSIDVVFDNYRKIDKWKNNPMFKALVKRILQKNFKKNELSLRKELLLVEMPRVSDYHADAMKLWIRDHETDEEYNIKGCWGVICKASELTEDVAAELVELHESGYYTDYGNENNFFTLPSKSFHSAVGLKRHKYDLNRTLIFEKL